MLAEFAGVARGPTYRERKIRIAYNVGGEVLSPEEATAPAYWVRHAGEAVRLAGAGATPNEQGARPFLGLGPGPVLCAMARECLGDEGGQAAFIPTLREGRAEAEAISTAIAPAHVAGAKLEWEAFFAGTGATLVPPPTYPFQRKRYWLASTAGALDASAIGLTAAEHPLLGATVELADREGEGLLLTGRLSLATHPWLADHAVTGAVFLPGTAFLELALRAAEQAGAESVEELTLQAPLVLPESGAVAIQVSVSGPDEDGRREIAIHSRLDGEEGEWAQNATGALSEAPTPISESLDVWPPEGAEPLEVDHLYDRLAEHGLEYGPAFQSLTATCRDGDQIYAELSLPEEQAQEAERFGIHPALLDAALHGITLTATEGSSELSLPFSWGGVSLRAEGARELRVRITPGAEGEVSLALADGAGAPLATVASLISRTIDPTQLRGAGQRQEGGLLELAWAAVPLAAQDTAPPEVELLRLEPEGDDDADPARKAAQSALEAVQTWLAHQSKAGCPLALGDP